MADVSRRKSSVVSQTLDDDGVVRVTDDAVRRLSASHANIGQEQLDAKAAFQAEQSMTVRQAMRLYKKAILFSMAMSLAVVMEG
jgi:SP family general alpha glucoside:H+ symporter-like MFS transporter